MIARLAAATLAAATPPPLPVQPAAERARQALAPQSPDPLWRTLAHPPRRRRPLGVTMRALSTVLLLTLAATPALAAKMAKSSLRAAPAASSQTSGQAAGERSVQQGLPQSKAPLWATLRKTKITEDSAKGVFVAAFPPEVKALNQQTLTLSGFMLPLDAQARSKHFLLSKYTPVCFFCPPGEPNEVVEVVARTGVPVTDRMLSVTGRMGLINQAEQGLFFKLDQADVK